MNEVAKTFETPGACRAEIAAALKKYGESVGAAIADELHDQFRESSASGSVGVDLLGMKRVSRLTRWVIREEDIKLLDFVCSGLLVAGSAASAAPVPAVVLGAVVAVVRVAYSLVRHGVHTNPLQHKILLQLRSHTGGLTTSELAAQLNASFQRKDDSWTEREINEELQSLTAMVSQAGAKAIVYSDSDKQWHMVD